MTRDDKLVIKSTPKPPIDYSQQSDPKSVFRTYHDNYKAHDYFWAQTFDFSQQIFYHWQPDANYYNA